MEFEFVAVAFGAGTCLVCLEGFCFEAFAFAAVGRLALGAALCFFAVTEDLRSDFTGFDALRAAGFFEALEAFFFLGLAIKCFVPPCGRQTEA